ELVAFRVPGGVGRSRATKPIEPSQFGNAGRIDRPSSHLLRDQEARGTDHRRSNPPRPCVRGRGANPAYRAHPTRPGSRLKLSTGARAGERPQASPAHSMHDGMLTPLWLPALLQVAAPK